MPRTYKPAKDPVEITCANPQCGQARIVGRTYAQSKAYLESDRLCARCGYMKAKETVDRHHRMLFDNAPDKSVKLCTGCGIVRIINNRRVIPPVCRTCRHQEACIEIVTTDALRDLLDQINEMAALERD